MTVKLERKVYTMTENDRILDNGKLYILLTQTYFKDWSYINPKIPKSKFEKWKKDGYVKLCKEKYKSMLGHDMDIYAFTKEALKEESL